MCGERAASGSARNAEDAASTRKITHRCDADAAAKSERMQTRLHTWCPDKLPHFQPRLTYPVSMHAYPQTDGLA